MYYLLLYQELHGNTTAMLVDAYDMSSSSLVVKLSSSTAKFFPSYKAAAESSLIDKYVVSNADKTKLSYFVNKYDTTYAHA